MTAVAVPHVPLTSVLVTTEAGGHIGPKGRVFVADIDVATHAIPRTSLGVSGMRKDQVLTRHFRRVSRARASVALRAGVWIVWVLVAVDALLRRRKVERPGFPSVLNPSVAFEAVDPVEHVGSMLEVSLLRVFLDSEHFGARARKAGQGNEHDDGDYPAGHFFGHSA